MRDAERHQRQTKSLMEFAMSNDANTSIIQGWVDKWQPLADKAIDAYCAALTDLPDAAEDAKAYVISVRKSFGLA